MFFNRSINKLLIKNTTFYFWLFIVVHTLIWAIGPALARPSLPHDTLEGITWGLQWQWGYHKHPFITAWLCAGVTQLFGTVGWPVYLLAQLIVSATFLAVWQLAKEFLPPKHALIAALVLEGVLFYNINSFNVTPDTLQSPLWALLSLFLYRAITSQKIYYWLLTALFAALCLCTKYQIIVLLVPMFLFCLYNPLARLSFKKPGFYCAVVTFLLLISPHLIWLYQHEFVTLSYAEHISSEYTQTKTVWNHLSYPLNLLVNAFISVVGLFILLWPFYGAKKETNRLTRFQLDYLIFIGIGPFVVSLLLCVITGDYFPPRWFTPYFFLLGVMSMVYLKPGLSGVMLKRFGITLVVFSSLLFVIRIASLTLFPRTNSDAFLPNQQIAMSLSTLWHDTYHKPLVYIAGSNYLVAMVTPYIPDKPKPYLSWSHEESPWINEQKLREQGGLFIWDEGQNYAWDSDSRQYAQLSAALLHRFPKLKIMPHYTFYTSLDKRPILVGVAILPPDY